MAEQTHSALLRELTIPLLRPKFIVSEGSPSTSEVYVNNVAARLIPVRIEPNPDLVPRILDKFRNFCELHPNRGNHPLSLLKIQAARVAYESESSFLTTHVFRCLCQALRDLEPNTRVNFMSGRFELRAIGTREDGLWFDSEVHMSVCDANEPARVVWQQKSPQEAMRYFQDMNDRAKHRVNFNPRAICFEGADSIIVKVRSLFFFFLAQLLLRSWFYFYFQGAVDASFRSSRYVVYHSNFDMIVHRLVPLSGNEYYLEASPRIPIDSQRYPHLAVIAAIIFDARTRAPAWLMDAQLSVDKYYNGLKRSSPSVRSLPSQFISSFSSLLTLIVSGSAPF
jgi:hypothetical protein